MATTPAEGHEFQPDSSSTLLKRVTRRGFLGLGAKVLGAGLLARYAQPIVSAAEALKAPNPSSQETIHSLEVSPRTEQRYQGLTLFIDSSGIPDGYLIEGSATGEVAFSDEEKRFFRTRRGIAMAGTEFLPVRQIQALDPHFAEPTPEKPYVQEKPENVLTPEELAENGVTISYAEETPESSKLFIRSSAFEDSGVLEAFKLLRDNSSEGEQIVLEMVVRNSQNLHISPDWIDSTTNSVKLEETNLIEAVQEYRSERVMNYEYAIQDLFRKRRDLEPGDPHYMELTHSIYLHRASQMLFVRTLSDAELLPYVVDEKLGTTMGRYYPLEAINSLAPDRNTTLLTVAAPELYKAVDSTYYTVGFKTDGSVVISSDPHGAANLITARIDQSYPNPAEYEKRDDGSEYHYKVKSIGFVLYHELAHFLMIDVFPKLAAKGLLGQSKAFRALMDDDEDSLALELRMAGVTPETFPSTPNEALTDLVAMSFIRQAYKRWQESGFTDDSGYAFLFEVPKDRFHDGGYQITEAQLPKTELSV